MIIATSSRTSRVTSQCRRWHGLLLPGLWRQCHKSEVETGLCGGSCSLSWRPAVFIKTRKRVPHPIFLSSSSFFFFNDWFLWIIWPYYGRLLTLRVKDPTEVSSFYLKKSCVFFFSFSVASCPQRLLGLLGTGVAFFLSFYKLLPFSALAYYFQLGTWPADWHNQIQGSLSCFHEAFSLWLTSDTDLLWPFDVSTTL